MPKLESIHKGLQKVHGNSIGAFGGFYETAERIPTGIFPLDLSIGGGIPRGRVTEVFGPEGSTKTNLCMKVIASNQLIRPKERAVVFDMEGTFDPNWARKLGVDMDRVLVLRPDFAEDLHDLMVGTVDKAGKPTSFGVIDADDVGVIVLDSLAAVITTKEGESSAENVQMGNSAIAIRKIVNKLTVKMKKMRLDESGTNSLPAMIWVNQVRTKLGQMFGDPESTPGGNAPRFMYSLRLRLYGKAIMDKKVSDVLPAIRKVTCSVRKNKIPVTSMHSEYDIVMVPHGGFGIGDIDDWNLIEQKAKEFGLLTSTKKGYQLGPDVYKTITEMRKRYYSDPKFKLDVRGAIVKIAVDNSGFVMTDDQIKAADAKPMEEEFEYDKETGEILEPELEEAA